MKKNYIRVNEIDYKNMKKGLKGLASLEKKYHYHNVQSVCFMKDSIIGFLMGVKDMSRDLHGWDGWFEDNTPFENKNVTAHAKNGSTFGLVLRDTSDKKLEELKNGVFTATSAWDDACTPAFAIIGNTKSVGDILENSFDVNNRRTCTVSLPMCLQRGFKIVALDYDKEKTMATISSKFPKIGQTLTFNDILCGENEIKAFVESVK